MRTTDFFVPEQITFVQPRGSTSRGSGDGCCTLGSGTSRSLKPAAYSTANTSRKHLATRRAMTAGLQHVIFLSYRLGRWSVAGSPRTCQMLFISQIWLGRVHRNLQSAWEHLGAAEEGGFVTGPRNSHLGAREERRRCCSGHLWQWDSAPLGSAPPPPCHRLDSA